MIGHRVPEPILRVANRLLPLNEVDSTESRSVRSGREPPAWDMGSADGRARRVARVTLEMKRLHRVTGVAIPPRG